MRCKTSPDPSEGGEGLALSSNTRRAKGRRGIKKYGKIWI